MVIKGDVVPELCSWTVTVLLQGWGEGSPWGSTQFARTAEVATAGERKGG